MPVSKRDGMAAWLPVLSHRGGQQPRISKPMSPPNNWWVQCIIHVFVCWTPHTEVEQMAHFLPKQRSREERREGRMRMAFYHFLSCVGGNTDDALRAGSAVRAPAWLYVLLPQTECAQMALKSRRSNHGIKRTTVDKLSCLPPAALSGVMHLLPRPLSPRIRVTRSTARTRWRRRGPRTHYDVSVTVLFDGRIPLFVYTRDCTVLPWRCMIFDVRVLMRRQRHRRVLHAFL